MADFKADSSLGWIGNIEALSVANDHFRKVEHTGAHAQLTLMSIAPGEDIGWEAHESLDQFLRLEQGQGRVDFGRSEDQVDESFDVSDDWAIIVPAGVWHNLVNTGTTPVKLYSIYSPPEHPAGTIHPTKADAEADEHHH